MSQGIYLLVLIASSFFIDFSSSQQAGTVTPEVHPALPLSVCTQNGCTQASTLITLDSNWRWIHNVGGYTNCYTGNSWDPSYCSNPTSCAQNCALDGVDYPGTYGITTSGNSLRIKFVTQSQSGKNVGSRVYMMQDDTTYQMFKLKNREFTFDVDVSNLPCGLNGALYFVEMSADGGMSQYPGNRAGAKFGTGYCDAQCPQDIKFINGEANLIDWTPSPVDPNSGTGMYGTCCVEMDIWEANSVSSAYTPHSCTVQGQTRCNGTDCGQGSQRYAGVCDKDGCDFNSYRMGDKTFFGPSMVIDTEQPFTVVTQFITQDGTDTGPLSEIKRFYVQDGNVIPNSVTQLSSMGDYNSISEDFCAEQKNVTGDTNDFDKKGGFASMSKALENGMVLVMSLWDDYSAYMLWLDSDYPTTSPPTQPGVSRGTCPTSSGRPADVESKYPNAYVTFSNIKVGNINTTFPAESSF